MSAPRRIHVVFKTHLDVGFTDLARRVVRTYTENFIPRAVVMARGLREKHGGHRFIWTTGSWLIHHALETGSPKLRRDLEAAIEAGDIVWHALPFTTHSELMDAPLFRTGLGLSRELDRRFGKKTIAAKMTDVPGHTRAIVPLLAEAGVELLHLGVNPASTPPDTPDAFRWRDESSSSEVVVLYEKGDYGGLACVPGCADALFFAHTGDNLGPCSPDEVETTFSDLKTRFPRAEIFASTLDSFARALVASRGTRRLPVLTQELGDTWIHGVGTDPEKVSRFRALRAWRNGLNGSADKATAIEKEALRRFDRRLLLVPEHTWGHDVKLCLGFEKNYDRRFAAAAFRRARSEAPYRKLEASWREQRAYLDAALAELRGTRFATEARSTLRRLRPCRLRHAAAVPGTVFETPGFEIALDPETGSVTQLIDRRTGRRLADARHPIGRLSYEVFSAADYASLWRNYNRDHVKNRHWAMPDFLKPGVETAVEAHQTWTPALRRLSEKRSADGGLRLLADLAFDDDTPVRRFGAPRAFQVEITVAADRPELRFVVQWFGKPATRVPEATWFSFRPRLERAADAEIQLRKMGSWINPRDVVRDGNRTLHAVEACRYLGHDGQVGCLIENPDAPLVAPGRPSLVRFGNRLPRVSDGLHFNLHNNTWGTNFPLWYEEDARFEFRIRTAPPDTQ